MAAAGGGGGGLSPLSALRRAQQQQPGTSSSSSARKKASVRGDLGDAGRRGRRTHQPGGRSAVSSANGDEDDAMIGAGAVGEDDDAAQISGVGDLDETQVKGLFRQFIHTFGGGADGENGTSLSSATAAGRGRSQRNDDGDRMMDVDLDAMGGAGQVTASRGGGGGSAASKYLKALHRIVEGADAFEGQSAFPSSGRTNGSNGSFPVDLGDLQSFSGDLFNAVVAEPANSIVFMDECLVEIVGEEFPELGAQGAVALGLRVCLFNHPRLICMRALNPSDIESLVALRGIVIRASHVIPDMQVAIFRCTARVTANQVTHICGHEEECRLQNGEVAEPIVCPACSQKFSFELVHTKCTFGDKQLLKIQETPESIPEGETPHTVMAYAYDEWVDVAKPGDRIELCGIYKASGVRVLAKQRNLKAVYRTYLDVVHLGKERLGQFQLTDRELDGTGSKSMTKSEYEKLSSAGGGQDISTAGAPNANSSSSTMFSQEVVRELKAIAAQPDIHGKLVESLAPNIWEHQDVKKGLLCQLFGGNPKRLMDRTARGDVHVLLCGDPSTAKSQLLQYVNNLAPRGVYTCGRGTSAVGLTASVTRDAETREFVLESGAIVLSDRGICCIDEFDKMDDGARIILHEVMEQQTVSIAKAGIVCSVNARTSILASANPVSSKYDTRRSVVENINLPPTLLSRFDLIYLMLDNNNDEVDRQLAAHICSLYAPEEVRPKKVVPIPRDLLAKYVSYARSSCFPVLSEPAGQELIQTYLTFRRQGTDASGKSLSATPRQLESLVRLSESLARMQLVDIVTPEHVREAARIIQVATYSAIVDPVTGRIDFEQLNRGVSGLARERREVLEKALRDLLSSETAGLDKESLTKRLSEKLFDSADRGIANLFSRDTFAKDLEQTLRNLELMGTVAKTHGGKYVAHA